MGIVSLKGSTNYRRFEPHIQKFISNKGINIFYDCFLNQVVDIPTRGNKILDLVSVNRLNIVEDLKSRWSFR